MPPDRRASRMRRDPRRRRGTSVVACGALIDAGSMSGAPPGRVRVALEFRTPFPDALLRALGTP